MDISELVKKAKKGDKDALVKLIMDRKEEYYRLAYSYMGSREEALDALQDMIVILFDKIRTLKKDDSFISFSKTILANCCRNALKKNKKMIPMDQQEVVYLENFKLSETYQDIKTGLKKLNPNQQEAIRLKYLLDMDYETISRITNTSVGTVKSRIFNGLARLREIMGGEYL